MSRLLEQSLLAAHLMSAAAWFGALVYRTFFVDPKALRFFDRFADFENFSLHLAHNMRYVVAAALVTCGLSGVGLIWFHAPTASPDWWGLMAAKSALWAVAFAVFVYISWVYWPRRLFAATGEVAAVRRAGVGLSLLMIGLAGAGMLLGQLCRP